MEDGRIICTKNKTGHNLLVETRFEFPGGEYGLNSEVEWNTAGPGWSPRVTYC